MRKKLTDLAVETLKPPATGQVDVYDTIMPRLVLRLGYGGSKTWRALYYQKRIAKSGKRQGERITVPTVHTLGRFPVLSVKKARVFLADPRRARGIEC